MVVPFSKAASKADKWSMLSLFRISKSWILSASPITQIVNLLRHMQKPFPITSWVIDFNGNGSLLFATFWVPINKNKFFEKKFYDFWYEKYPPSKENISRPGNMRRRIDSFFYLTKNQKALDLLFSSSPFSLLFFSFFRFFSLSCSFSLFDVSFNKKLSRYKVWINIRLSFYVIKCESERIWQMS